MKAKWIGIMVMAVLTFSACEKDNEPSLEVIPDELEGKWIHEDKDFGSESRLVIEKVSEKSGRFESYWNVELEGEEEMITLIAIKADFVIKAQKIVATITQCGSQLNEFEDDQVLDEIVWFTPEDDEWEWFDLYDTFYVVYELKNDQLIIKEDGNGDGDYNDEGEQTIFVREK